MAFLLLMPSQIKVTHASHFQKELLPAPKKGVGGPNNAFTGSSYWILLSLLIGNDLDVIGCLRQPQCYSIPVASADLIDIDLIAAIQTAG